MIYTNAPTGGRVWPICRVDSGTMPSTGDRIRRARIAAGLSQHELAVATRVGERTIGRIETDQGGSVRSIRRLEEHLRLHHAEETAEDEVDLSTVSSTALLAEVATRIAAGERRGGPTIDGPPVRVRFMTEEGPTQSGTSDQHQRVQNHPNER